VKLFLASIGKTSEDLGKQGIEESRDPLSMTKHFEDLLEAAKKVVLTPEEKKTTAAKLRLRQRGNRKSTHHARQ
jgi:hypothetical protein